MTGPKRPILAPAIRPPAISLLRSVGITEDPDLRWVNGATFEPEICGDDAESYVICTDEAPTKDPGETVPDSEEFDAVALIAPYRCSPFTSQDYEYFTSKARAKLAAWEHKLVERVLWTGEGTTPNGGTVNPHLTQAGIEDLGAGLPADVVDAIACLEDFLANCAPGGTGFIHVSRKVTPALASETQLLKEGNLLRTWAGNIVVPGVGYDGSAPDDSPAQAGSEYIYATGPIEIRMGPVQDIPQDLGGATERTQNTIVIRAERPALVTFDSCCVAGIEVVVADCGASGS